MRTGFVWTICHCIDITASPPAPQRILSGRHLKRRQQTAVVQSRHPSLAKPWLMVWSVWVDGCVTRPQNKQALEQSVATETWFVLGKGFHIMHTCLLMCGLSSDVRWDWNSASREKRLLYLRILNSRKQLVAHLTSSRNFWAFGTWRKKQNSQTAIFRVSTHTHTDTNKHTPSQALHTQFGA